jgi:hypothetical protein
MNEKKFGTVFWGPETDLHAGRRAAGEVAAVQAGFPRAGRSAELRLYAFPQAHHCNAIRNTQYASALHAVSVLVIRGDYWLIRDMND